MISTPSVLENDTFLQKENKAALSNKAMLGTQGNLYFPH